MQLVLPSRDRWERKNPTGSNFGVILRWTCKAPRRMRSAPSWRHNAAQPEAQKCCAAKARQSRHVLNLWHALRS
jgi:hypothetical protein